ncbi:MAG: M23 family metallopeptidase [Actinobacteria bacterium]|nr:MAG: M23 family metallopeptidase [Actinomycetota bacterium]
MRLRFLATLCSLGVLLLSSTNASAYPWPIKPFDQQHPIRANFGDPRTRFLNTMLTDGLQGPGTFAFHNGIDIAAPADTPVYPVISGQVRYIDGSAISVKTKGRGVFQYFHLVVTVRNREHVVAGKTILGYVMHAYDHVHLSEIRGGRVWNPLARGGIAPYRDHTVPAVDAINVRPAGSLLSFDSDTVCGLVSIVAAAHDMTPIPIPGVFGGFPVSPALVTWSLYRVGGSTYVRDADAADFRTTLPSAKTFWNVYARGSYQNAPRFSNRQYFVPGRFLYNLARGIDTRAYPNGLYEVLVHVADMRGNASDAALQFIVANHPGTETGCPAHAPSSAP